MFDKVDPVPHWTRAVAHLRNRAVKIGLRRPGTDSPNSQVADEALTSCDALLRDLAGAHLECERLGTGVRAEAARWEHLFELVPGPCILTDQQGLIINANRAAGLLLNVSVTALHQRQLRVFTEPGENFQALLHSLSTGHGQLRATLTLRPREQGPFETDVIVAPHSPNTNALWLWFFVASDTRHGTKRDALPVRHRPSLDQPLFASQDGPRGGA
jgi:PAS domain-containing protein